MCLKLFVYKLCKSTKEKPAETGCHLASSKWGHTEIQGSNVGAD